MPGTKIINVLKDDSFKDILDLFRKTEAEDVVFVLPKRSAVFKREDHFAAFASEAQRTGKQISIMCSNPDVNDWANKYNFAVIGKKAPKPKAVAAVALNDEDEEVRDPNTDAFDKDVPATTDESQNVTDENAIDEEEGMHVEDENALDEVEKAAAEPSEDDEPDDEGENFDQVLKQYGPNDMAQYDEDGNLIGAPGAPVTATLAVSRSLDGIRSRTKGKRVGVKSRAEQTVKVGVKAQPKESLRSDIADGEDPDYIDTVWRETVGEEAAVVASKDPSRWSGLFAKGTNRRRSDRPARRTVSGRSRTVLTAVVVTLALVGGAFLILGMGNASVQLVPVSRDLEFELSVQSSDAFTDVDPLFNKIPGQLFEIEKSIEREFSSSGSQEVAVKAKGLITVSNGFSDSPQTLIATTRFEDPDGHIYRTLRTITVPGKSAGEPGTIAVEVVADKPGPDFNIEAGDFVIPAFQEQGLTARYEQITGSSEKAFVGGALGLSGIVTQEDMDKAIAEITEELQSLIQQSFDAESVDLQLINATQVNITDVEVSADVDQAVDTFTVSASGVLSTVGFRADDLFVLMKDHAQQNWQLKILSDQVELHYDDIRFVEDRGILSFSVTVLTRGYEEIDTDAVIAEIRGKNRQDVRDYFRGAENVRSSTVVLSPLWVRSVPDDSDSISLEILFEAPMSQ